jgi:Ras-related protein Rab-18
MIPTGETPVNCKILLLGDVSVGKSSLVVRFADKTWLSEGDARPTVGVDYRVSILQLFSSHPH